MQAYLYVIVEDERTRMAWTLCPEMDVSYWLDSAFYEAVAYAAGNSRSVHRAYRRTLLFWSEMVPLGEAMEAAARWTHEQYAGGRAIEQTAEKLIRMVARAGEDGGKGSKRTAGAPPALMEFGSPVPLKRQRTGRVEVWQSRSHDGMSGRENSLVLGNAVQAASAAYPAEAAAEVKARVTRHTMRALYSQSEARSLARQACRSADQLLGRGLLAPEAVALLGAADIAGAAPLLTLAALLGRLRLSRAIAPAPAPPAGRRWLRRPGSADRARPLRCERCGSGEPRLRRTACAACGRSACAYCEACLTMGRARECGLLILGMPAAPPGAASAIAAPSASMAARLAPWKLSPAQEAAAAAALRFIDGEAPHTRLPRWRRWLQLHRRGRDGAGAAPSAHAAPASPAAPHLSPAAAAPTPAAPHLSPAAAAPTPAAPHLSPAAAAPTPAAPHLAPAVTAVPRRFLLWAVTGAGKTEMIFPLLASALAKGGRALIATPRRDVVLELDPRIRQAFPNEAVVTLYGGSAQRWESGGITLATTHQLLRFREAFDLVVIDEIDAFPYHNDPMLAFAAERVCKPGGATVLLSATPPAKLQTEAKRGKLPFVRVPVRFHRHPLPVPVLLSCQPVRKLVQRRQAPATITRALRTSIDRGAQLFVFVQQIRHVAPLVERLRRWFPHIVVEGTSSKDDDRTSKVQRFRRREIRLLVTTTILERGVTVPRSDVFILDADGKLFDEASLIQMAGRAGRSKDDPAGKVYFCAPARNQAQQRAVRQIKAMNRLAGKLGYLKR